MGGLAPLPTVAIVSAIASLAIVGCSSTSEAPVGPTESPTFEAALEDARASGASQPQLDVLRRAADHGEVTLADVRAAVDETLACLTDAGFRTTVETIETPWGVPEIYYERLVPTSSDLDAAEALGDACVEQNSIFVEQLYAQQPSTVVAKDRHRDTVVIPGLLSCLEQWDFHVDDDQDFSSIWDETVFIWAEHRDVLVDGRTLGDCLAPHMEAAG